MARITGFVKRERQFNVFGFVSALIGSTLRGAGMTLSGLLQEQELGVSKIALHKRFSPSAVEFLEELFNKTLIALHWENQSGYRKVLGQFKRVIIFDSCGWTIPESLADIFPGSGGAGSKAGCKLQLGYELKGGTFINSELTAGNIPDQRYARHIGDYVSKGDLALFDLGFVTNDLLEELDDDERYFVVRLRTGTVLEDEAGKPIKLAKLLKKARLEGKSNIEFTAYDTKHKIKLRVIATLLSPQEKEQRIRKMRKDNNRKIKHLSRSTREFAGWCVYTTNAPVEILPSSTISELYRIRWSIELMFKQFKSTLKLNQINHANEYRLRCELFAKLIVAAIIASVHGKFQSALYRDHKTELSIYKVFKLFNKRAEICVNALFGGTTAIIKFFASLKQEIPRWCKKEDSRTRPTTFRRIDSSLAKPIRFCKIRISDYA